MKPVQTDTAPAAIGPYSQAIVHNGLVYTSGQLALQIGRSGLAGDTAADQAQVVLANLKAILRAAGSEMDKVIKTTIFLANMDDFASVNAVYAQAFGDHRPARSTVQVAKLPLGALVEIECVAAVE